MKIFAEDVRRVFVLFTSLILLVTPLAVAATSEVVPTISFGDPVASASTVSIPVYLDPAGANDISAWAICVRAPKDALRAVTIHRAAHSQLQPQFETTVRNADSVTYIAWSSENVPAGVLQVVDVEVAADQARNLHLELDKQLTTVSDRGGLHARTAMNGGLKLEAGIEADKPGNRRRAAK